MTITGAHFTSANAVNFGFLPATAFVVDSATQITATPPAHDSGTVDVTVTTPAGTSATSIADQFTFAGAPVVSAISPTAGPLAGGTTVVIAGTGFTAAGEVRFGAVGRGQLHRRLRHPDHGALGVLSLQQPIVGLAATTTGGLGVLGARRP